MITKKSTKNTIYFIYLFPFLIFFFEIYSKGFHITNLPDYSLIIARNILLVWLAHVLLLVFSRKLLPRSLFSIYVFSALSLVIKITMMRFLELDTGLITVLYVLVSAFLEAIPLILFRIVFNRKYAKIIYFIIFNLLLLIQIADLVYLKFTNTHFEKVLFDNINLSSISGFLSTFSLTELLVAFFLYTVILISIFYFDISKPTSISHVVRVARYYSISLLVLILILLSSNIVNRQIGSRFFDLHTYLEKTRYKYRNVLIRPSLYSLIKPLMTMNQEKKAVPKKFIPYSKNEKDILVRLGLIREGSPALPVNKLTYEKIILILFESLPIDYISYYNKEIPDEATPFLSHLLSTYPSLDNFFSSGKPTLQGFSAIFLSKIGCYRNYTDKPLSESLFSVLQKNGFKGYLIRPTSKFYSDEKVVYPRLFKMQHLISKEELDLEYTGASGWGHHNNTIYDKGINILSKNRNSKLFLVLKTIDLHQPGTFTGFKENEIPLSLRNSPELIKSLFWADTQLRKFFNTLKNRGLYDNKTLIVLTSDHSPNLGSPFKEFAIEKNYLPLARIPLIFVSFDKIQVNPSCYASQIDIAPTILGILGIKYPHGFTGRDLRNKGRGMAIGSYDNTFYYRTGTIELTLDKSAVYDDLRKIAIKKWLENINSQADIHSSSKLQ